MPVLITPEVAQDIAKIIREHHAAVAAVLYGPEAVSKADWEAAVKLGLVDPSKPEAIFEALHVYGALLAHVDQAELQSRYGTTLADFMAEISKNPIPQTKVEHHSADYMRTRGAQYIVGLGNKKGAKVGTKLIEADQQLDRFMRGTIRDVISARFGDDEAALRIKKLGVDKGLPDDFFDDQFRSTIREQVSDIGHLTEDWARDLQRIVQTETHGAVQEGQQESWTEQEEELAQDQKRTPRKLKAFKLPRPDACKHCIRLHLEGAEPRVYYLDEITANGTNVGRKAPDWLIVIGSIHPWCFPPGVQVTTAQGSKAIESIRVGDLALTHRGRWRRVTRLSRRWFSGDLLSVNGLWTTPEHPFLTGRGWHSARNLVVGEHLFEVKEPIASNAYNAPSLRPQENLFASILRSFARRVMPVTTVNFDGDFVRWYREICKEATNWVARLHLNPMQSESLRKGLFEFGHQLAAHPTHALAYEGVGMRSSPSSGVGGSSLGFPFRRGLLRSDQTCGVCGSSLDSARSFDAPDYCESRYSEFVSDRVDRQSFAKMEPADLRGSDVGVTFSAHGAPTSNVAVRSIKTVPYSGWVYNFAVDGDESYVAEGLAVHNCACTLHRVPAILDMPHGWRSGDAAPGVIGPGGRIA